MRGQFDFILKTLTGANNVNIYDDIGIPSIMVRVPKFKISDVIPGGPSVTHPMFIIDGVEKDAIYMGKFEASVFKERAYSLPGKIPYNKASFADAVNYCFNKGEGWHAMTNSEYAGVMLLSKSMGTLPRGNDYNGRSNKKIFEHGRLLSAGGYSLESGGTDSGTANSIVADTVSHYAGEQMQVDWTGTDQSVDLTGVKSFKLDSYNGGSVDGTTKTVVNSGTFAVPTGVSKINTRIKRRTDKLFTDPTVVMDIGGTIYNTKSSTAEFVIKDGDIFKMWFVGYDGTYQRILYTTSNDGVNWATPVLSLDKATCGTYNALGNGGPWVIKESDTSYKMWFPVVDASSVYRIAYSTSADGITWNTPVLSMDIGGTTFNTKYSYHPCVIKESDTAYKMWFSGFDGTNNRILYATSTDGIRWNTPVVSMQNNTHVYSKSHAYIPRVYKGSDGVYRMWFTGNNGTNNRVLYSTSSDGVAWGTPILAMDIGLNSYATVNVAQPAIVKEGNKYHTWFSSDTGNVNVRIQYCTFNTLPENPGNEFTMDNGVSLAISKAIKTIDISACKYSAVATSYGGHTFLISSTGKYMVWYSGSDGTNYRILYTESSDLKTWSSPVIAIDKGAAGTKNSVDSRDPFILKESDTLFRLYFTAGDGTNQRIMYSESTDSGKTWGTPVLAIDIATGTAYSNNAFAPSVIKESDGTYKMWFDGYNGSKNTTLYATSTDGKTWTGITGLVIPGDENDPNSKSFGNGKTICAGRQSFGIKSDGTVQHTVTTQGADLYSVVTSWTNIVAITSKGSSSCVVGLKSDGTVITTDDYFNKNSIKGWSDIVDISASEYVTFGLKKDGTVLATHIDNTAVDYGQTNVSGWRDIIAISAGTFHTVGLKSDGTVVSTTVTSTYDKGQTNVSGWRDIIAISAGTVCTVGLKKDGTVVCTDANISTRISSWKNIVDISAGYASNIVVGVDIYGNAVWSTLTASDSYGAAAELYSWRDLVSIDTNGVYTLGLKKDGTVLASGADDTGSGVDQGPTLVSNWKNISTKTTGYFTNATKYKYPAISKVKDKYVGYMSGTKSSVTSYYRSDSTDGKTWSTPTPVNYIDSNYGTVASQETLYDGTKFNTLLLIRNTNGTTSLQFTDSTDGTSFTSQPDGLSATVVNAVTGKAVVTVLEMTKSRNFSAGEKLRFDCVGAPIKFNTMNITKMKIECYGASGGDAGSYTGGKGGYAYGQFSPSKAMDLFLLIGGRGGLKSNSALTAYNGGGSWCIPSQSTETWCGGGATDIRTSLTDISRRFIVAGGAGSADSNNGNAGDGGGYTGGLGSGLYPAGGGTQTTYGTVNAAATDFDPTGGSNTDNSCAKNYTVTASLSGTGNSPLLFGPGGGGWFAGGSSSGSGGAGGSSYIAGDVNCPTVHPDGITLTSTGTTAGANTQKDGYIVITVLETTDTARYIVGDKVRFNYTGAPQTFIQGNATKVKVECFGASGGYTLNESKGGYAYGDLSLDKIDTLSILVGGMGKPGVLGTPGKGGYNGGGDGGKPYSDDFLGGSGGGGATDVRSRIAADIFDADSLASRLVVAGGGGGDCSTSIPGDGGGISGIAATTLSINGASMPGSQKSGFALGKGGVGDDATDSKQNSGDGNGGGGAGYFGGFGGTKLNGAPGNDVSGAGGSSYIAGDPNCPTPHSNNITLANTGTTASTNLGDGYVIITILAVSTDRKYVSGETFTFNCINDVQTFNTKNAKRVRIECYGAEGAKGDDNCGTPGKGGYAKGDLILNTPQTLQLLVGGRGGYNTGKTCGYNGGGKVTCNVDSVPYYGSGATDVRTVAGDLNSRIIVAGAGGSSQVDRDTVANRLIPVNGLDGGDIESLFDADCTNAWQTPVLSIDTAGTGNANGCPYVMLDNGIYKMWFHRVISTSGSGKIMYATSSDGKTWSEPVVVMNSGTNASGYNATQSQAPCVLKENGTYKMWFDGFASDGTRRLLYATSVDGINWTAPVLVMNIGTSSAGYNSTGNECPSVINDNGTYKMWWAGTNSTNYRILYATSSDGINWSAPQLAMNISTGYTSSGCHAPFVIKESGTYRMWFGGYNGTTWRLLYSTSTDGVTWSAPSLSLDINSDVNNYTSKHVLGQSIVKVGNLYKMWFGASDANSTWRIMHTFYTQITSQTIPVKLPLTASGQINYGTGDTIAVKGNGGIYNFLGATVVAYQSNTNTSWAPGAGGYYGGLSHSGKGQGGNSYVAGHPQCPTKQSEGVVLFNADIKPGVRSGNGKIIITILETTDTFKYQPGDKVWIKYTGAPETFVPQNIKSAKMCAWGGNSATAKGNHAYGHIDLSSTDKLVAVVGGVTATQTGGFNGGDSDLRTSYDASTGLSNSVSRDSRIVDASGAGTDAGTSFIAGNSACTVVPTSKQSFTNSDIIPNVNDFSNGNGVIWFSVLSTIDNSVTVVDTRLIYTGTGPVSWAHNGNNEGILDLVGNLWSLVTGVRVDGSTKEIQIVPNNNAAKYGFDLTNEANWFGIGSDGSPVIKGTGIKYTNAMVGTVNVLFSALATGTTNAKLKALGLIPADSTFDYEAAMVKFVNTNSNTLMNVCYRGGAVGDATTLNSIFAMGFKKSALEDIDSNKGFRVCYYEP